MQWITFSDEKDAERCIEICKEQKAPIVFLENMYGLERNVLKELDENKVRYKIVAKKKIQKQFHKQQKHGLWNWNNLYLWKKIKNFWNQIISYSKLTLKLLFKIFLRCAYLCVNLVIAALWFLSFIAVVLVYIIVGPAIRYIGYGGIRVQKNKLQSAVVLYQHPVTKKEIVLVGTMHVGEWDYYTKIQAFLDNLSDKKLFTVLYEGSQHLTQEELESLSPEERGYVEMLASESNKMADVLLGLVRQDDVLVYRNEWIKSDISGYEMIKKLSEINTHIVPDIDSEGVYQAKFSYVRQWWENKFLAYDPVAVFFDYLKRFIVPSARKYWKIIVNDRNVKTAKDIMAQVNDGKDVVDVWGSMHLQGIGTEIEEYGFIKKETKWFTIYHIRPYNLLTAIKNDVMNDIEEHVTKTLERNLGIIGTMMRLKR